MSRDATSDHAADRPEESCAPATRALAGAAREALAAGSAAAGARWVIDYNDLQRLLDVLGAAGYRVIGPTRRDNAIVYAAIGRIEDLPAGWTDRQESGRYRLERRSDEALFGYNVGLTAWKRFLHEPRLRLWRARRENEGFQVEALHDDAPRYAFLGVRSCELHAIGIQDRVLIGDRHVDPAYRARREAAFIVAVNCAQAGGTCFCVATKTGPRVESGFDLALTELTEPGRHAFVVEAGSKAGVRVLDEVPHRDAAPEERAAADALVERTGQRMGRELECEGLRELLLCSLDHPHWDDVAARCLACGNCTMVCPTCFCTTVEEANDLDFTSAERVRRWDSCFDQAFSHLQGGSVRASTKSRYRQWMTHKLACWIEQFGSSGCVGCGRCITWCPAGIDITEEARAIRQGDGRKRGAAHGRS